MVLVKSSECRRIVGLERNLLSDHKFEEDFFIAAIFVLLRSLLLDGAVNNRIIYSMPQENLFEPFCRVIWRTFKSRRDFR